MLIAQKNAAMSAGKPADVSASFYFQFKIIFQCFLISSNPFWQIGNRPHGLAV